MKEEGYDTGLEGIWKGVLLGDEFNYLGPDGFAKFWREEGKIPLFPVFPLVYFDRWD
jgi:hypothetical protein